MPHVPVLLDEVLEILAVVPGKFVIDGTVDGGGHGLEIARRLGPKGVFIGVDKDSELLTKLKSRIAERDSSHSHAKITLIHGSYAELPEILENKKLRRADGLLLDLGFSSEQLVSGKGFSFQNNEPLDMRYDTSANLTAAEVVNQLSEKELADIFYHYGDERLSRRVAKEIIVVRKRKHILTTFDLVGIVKKAAPRGYERGRINPATRVFQALRIYVNDELGELEKALNNLKKIVVPGGRVAIISFHSLEDRIVKNNFREAERAGILKVITRKPIVPSDGEIAQNPRSRSAKLRAAELI